MDDLGKSEVKGWVAPAFLLCSVVLVPWIVYLAPYVFGLYTPLS